MSDNSYKQGSRTYFANGYQVLVEIDGVYMDETRKIIIPGEKLELERRLFARTTGVVRALGKLSYTDEPELRCNVGDHVTFTTYAGRDANRKVDGTLQIRYPLLRWMQDKDIIGVIVDDEDVPRVDEIESGRDINFNH